MADAGTSGPAAAQDVEVEWQFDALDLRPVERWLAALPLRGAELTPGAITAQATPARRLTDRYLDTADWRIGRAGFVLRTRQRGRASEATLKDDRPADASGLRTRLEFTEPLDDGTVASLSADGPVGRRVRAVIGRRRLQQILEVRTRRRPFALRAGGEDVAELTLDETAVMVGAGRPLQLRRVEVEVVPAWSDRLAPLVDELRRSCGLQPANLSKYEAGLLALGASVPAAPELGPTTVSPESTMGELAFAVLRRHFGLVLAREPGTRLGEDIEVLHDMRVATRRLRAAIDMCSDVLPARAAAINEELKWLAGVLGAVRDLDVQLERMDDMDQLAAALAARTDGSPLDELRVALEAQRVEARRILLDALDSARWERLVNVMTAMATRGPSRVNAPGRRPARLAAPPLVEARHERVRKAAKRARRSGVAADYHRLRIRAKRLRYSLEFVSDLYGARPSQVVRRLAKLQDTLGLLQDAEVATVRLLDLATTGDVPLSPLTVFAMGGVAEWYRADADRLLERLPRLLKAVKGDEWDELSRVMEEGRRDAAASLPAPRRRAAGVLTVVPELDSAAASVAAPTEELTASPAPPAGETVIHVAPRPPAPAPAPTGDELPPGVSGREAHPSGQDTINHTGHRGP
jgi:CHAD domain-containing protein